MNYATHLVDQSQTPHTTLDVQEIIAAAAAPANNSDTGNGHSHSNQSVLDATTASFTTADQVEISNLPANLAGKANANHSHDLSEIDNAGEVASYNLEQLQDAIAAMLQGGTHTNLAVNYNDADGTINLSATGGGGGLDQEAAEDIVGQLVDVAGNGISVFYDDDASLLTISLTGESYTTADRNKLALIAAAATANAADADLRDRSTHTGQQPISSVADLGNQLNGKAASDHSHAASAITLDASNFDGNLSAEVTNVQQLANAVDSLALESSSNSDSSGEIISVTELTAGDATTAEVQEVTINGTGSWSLSEIDGQTFSHDSPASEIQSALDSRVSVAAVRLIGAASGGSMPPEAEAGHYAVMILHFLTNGVDIPQFPGWLIKFQKTETSGTHVIYCKTLTSDDLVFSVDPLSFISFVPGVHIAVFDSAETSDLTINHVEDFSNANGGPPPLDFPEVDTSGSAAVLVVGYGSSWPADGSLLDDSQLVLDDNLSQVPSQIGSRTRLFVTNNNISGFVDGLGTVTAGNARSALMITVRTADDAVPPPPPPAITVSGGNGQYQFTWTDFGDRELLQVDSSQLSQLPQGGDDGFPVVDIETFNASAYMAQIVEDITTGELYWVRRDGTASQMSGVNSGPSSDYLPDYLPEETE